jgi:hypothetical protein
MPEWVSEQMPHTLQTTRLFDEGLTAGTALSPLPNRDPLILVSEPDRALLELASDIGKRRAKDQSLEEAMGIGASLRPGGESIHYKHKGCNQSSASDGHDPSLKVGCWAEDTCRDLIFAVRLARLSAIHAAVSIDRSWPIVAGRGHTDHS